MHKTIVSKKKKQIILLVVTLSAIMFGSLMNTAIEPIRAFGGVIWLKNGYHYMSDNEVNSRLRAAVDPKEETIASEISNETVSCDVAQSGFCKQSDGTYAEKILVTPAVAYVPAVPEKKTVVGYCTLCNDGTFSPSCAVGRGACSHHYGVSSYNVPRYRVTPGSPAIEAKPAVYTYSIKNYKNSPNYIAPETPTLSELVGY